MKDRHPPSEATAALIRLEDLARKIAALPEIDAEMLTATCSESCLGRNMSNDLSGEIVPSGGSEVASLPVFVTVSSEMEKAGLAELLDTFSTGDLSYVVRSIYMAMEYKRLSSLGQLGAITDDALQMLKRQS